MRYSDQSHIISIEDVQNFANYLYNERSVAFHPDDDFANYVDNMGGEQSFTDEEIPIFNRLMEECFKLCEKEKLDIYEVMSKFHPLLNSTSEHNG